MRLPAWLVNTVACAVLGVWVSSFVVRLYRPDFRPPDEVGWALMAVVGAAFASTGVSKMIGALQEVSGKRREDDAGGG